MTDFVYPPGYVPMTREDWANYFEDDFPNEQGYTFYTELEQFILSRQPKPC